MICETLTTMNIKRSDENYKKWLYNYLTHFIPLAASTTDTLESCPTQAILSPEAEKLTLCTHPPAM